MIFIFNEVGDNVANMAFASINSAIGWANDNTRILETGVTYAIVDFEELNTRYFNARVKLIFEEIKC